MGEAEGGARDAASATTPRDSDATGPHSLLVWAFAGFHVAFLVALVVAGLHLAGLAGNALAGLETWIGVAAYLYLWGVAWWTNRRVLDAVGLGLLTGTAGPTDLLVEASKWGGVAGFLAFLPALAVGIVLFVAAGGVEAVPIVLAGAAIGTVVSVGVGVLVGAGLALLDLLALRLARAWLPPQSGRAPSDPPDTGPAKP